MSKFKMGQTLYWFKYANNTPELMIFQVGAIKQTADGYKYSSGNSYANYVKEETLYDSLFGAIDFEIQRLMHFTAIQLEKERVDA